MVVPIPKIGYKKNPLKNGQVTALFYNYHFYYQKEAHKCLVFCSSQARGSKMVVSIPKTGYNKKTGKKWPSYDPFV